jgi:hypothetical protein
MHSIPDGGLFGKRLAAAGKSADVGAFASVNSSMSTQRADESNRRVRRDNERIVMHEKKNLGIKGKI